MVGTLSGPTAEGADSPPPAVEADSVEAGSWSLVPQLTQNDAVGWTSLPETGQ